MRTVFILVITFLLLARPGASAQENSFVFTHLKEDDGLSDNIANCFFTDSRGILWIGTYNGFNRYDGSNFFAYKKRKGSNSMLNEVVHSICEDKKGNIWGSTDNGVFCFELYTDRFINYAISSGDSKSFFEIICDKQGTIWTVGPWSIFRFNPGKNSFDEIKPASHPDSLKYFRIRKNGLLPDPSGKGLWMATIAGIMYYDIGSKSFFHSSNQPGDPLFAKKNTSALCQSPTGNIWFFNNDQNEIISFDPVSRKILQKISVHKEMPLANGSTLFEDRNHRLWFCSWTYDILLIDLANGNKTSKLLHRPDDNRTIAAQFFWDIFQDDDGTVWCATVSGVSRCNTENTIYAEFHLPEKIKKLNNEVIHIVEEDPADKSFWIITRSFLLFHYYRENGKYEIFDLKKAVPNASGDIPGSANSIKFLNDRVIITTYTGAWQLKKGSGRIVPYDLLPAGYADFKCSEIAFGGDSVVYFNNGRQLLYWNRLTAQCRILSYQPDPSIPTGRTIIFGLTLKPHQKLWMVSPGNSIASPGDGLMLKRLPINKEGNSNNGMVMSIDIDDTGKVWLIYRGYGLCRYDPATQVTTIWDESDGLFTYRMQKLKIDNKGRVWTIGYNKVSVFIPGPERFYNFRVPISENKLDYLNHISILSNGNVFTTINNEIVEFFPSRIGAVPNKRKPQISQVNIKAMQLAVWDDTSLFLQPSQNTIRLKFGSLTSNETFPYDLEYMLEGAENSWTTSTGNNEALYNNLQPGKYKFKVRARGKNNAWQTEETILPITIKNPFHKTIWFLLLIGSIICGAIIFIYRYRLRQKQRLLLLESKAQLLEKEKVMVMYESLKQQLNPHFLFNSLTSLSGLIETNQGMAGEFLEQMSGIYRYILKNGENETVLLKDEIDFVKLYISLQQTRFKKGLAVNINVQDEYLHYKIAPVTLQNLVENAIKHNIIDAASPLVIDIFIKDDYLIVKNNLQLKSSVETSNKKGLAQFTTLYSYLSPKPVIIEEKGKEFLVKIPLI